MSLLPHIAGRVFGTPLLISRAKLDTILGLLMPRLDGNPMPFGKPSSKHNFEITKDGIAIIPIIGTLVRRATGLDLESGLTSYSKIENQLSAALHDPAVKAILLDIDSPGGEAGGVFDLADKILQARGVKPIWAAANEEAFSAAYAIAAAAEKIFLPRTGGVGSIGVIAVHLDQSRAEDNAGLTYTAVYAGAHKNDLTPHEPLSDPARSELQAEVDRVYDIFVSTVARARGMDAQAVKVTEAALFFGNDAITSGLADEIGTINDALAAMTKKLTRPSTKPLRNLQRKEIRMNPEDPNNPAPEPAAPTEEEIREKAKAETMAYVSEVTEICQLAGCPDKTMGFITKAVPVAEIRKVLIDAKAAQADAITIAGQLPANTQTPTNAEPKIDTAAIYEARNKKGS
jgi:signal peptide peptidase SppA